MCIDQYQLENRIEKIVYQREKQFPFYERFQFVAKVGGEIGCMGKAYVNSQNENRTYTNIMVNEKKKVVFGPVPEDNFLVAIRVGLNKYGGLADIQFIYHKRT